MRTRSEHSDRQHVCRWSFIDCLCTAFLIGTAVAFFVVVAGCSAAGCVAIGRESGGNGSTARPLSVAADVDVSEAVGAPANVTLSTDEGEP